MSKQTFVLSTAILLLMVPLTAAHAQDKTGWGVSAAVGASQIRDKDGTETFQGNSFGSSLEFEYRFTPNFALGFGGFSLGSATDMFNSVDTEIRVRGYEVFGRLIYPLLDHVDAYGRLGTATYFVDIDPGLISLSQALFGDEAVELGVGIDFGRKEKLAFRLEGRYFNGSSDESGVLILFGVNYLF